MPGPLAGSGQYIGCLCGVCLIVSLGLVIVQICWSLIGLNILGLILICYNPQYPNLTVSASPLIG